MVSRRTLLSSVGLSSLAGIASLAGCTAIANDVPGGNGEPSADTGDGGAPSELAHPPDATHRAAVVGSDGPPDLPVRPAVAFANPYVTSGSSPVVRVTVENPTDEPIVVGEYRAVVFQYVTSEGGEYVWLPHSERSTDGDPDRTRPAYDVQTADCRRLASHPAQTLEYGTVEIPADGSLRAYVGLYATPEADRCVPLDDRRFETVYAYLPDGIGSDGGEQDRWGFTVRVERLPTD